MVERVAARAGLEVGTGRIALHAHDYAVVYEGYKGAGVAAAVLAAEGWYPLDHGLELMTERVCRSRASDL